MTKIQEEQKENELAQQEVLDMLQLQMAADEEEEDDAEEEKVESSKSALVMLEMERHAEEVRHFTDTISNLEDRIDEFCELVDQKNEEKSSLGVFDAYFRFRGCEYDKETPHLIFISQLNFMF